MCSFCCRYSFKETECLYVISNSFFHTYALLLVYVVRVFRTVQKRLFVLKRENVLDKIYNNDNKEATKTHRKDRTSNDKEGINCL